MPAKVIFSIDDVANLHQLSKFLRHIDTHRAMTKMNGPFQLCIGSWEDKLEYSFIMDSQDFIKLVDNFGWTDNQEAIIYLYDDGDCYIKYGPNEAEYLGAFVNVSEAEAKASKGWTYIMETDSYWVVK